jgi:hypothetical protein
MPSVRGNIYYAGNPIDAVRETFSAENTSAGTTDATGRYSVQIKFTHPPRNTLTLIGEVRCLAVEGGFFHARGEITEVHGGGSSGVEKFSIFGYDSGKHSTEPDLYDVYYGEPNFEGCRAPTTSEDLFPIQEGDIVITE